MMTDQAEFRHVIISAPASDLKVKIQYIYFNALLAVQLMGLGFIIGLSDIRYVPDQSLIYTELLRTEEWINGLIYIAIPFGVILAYLIFDSYGIKICLVVTNLFSLVGWAFIVAFTTHIWQVRTMYMNTWMMCIGRFLTGVSLGMTPVVCYTYLQDVTQAMKKKYIFAWIYSSIALGLLIKYLSTFLWSWYVSECLALGLVIVALLLVVLLPESPRWLLLHNKPAECALVRLRGGGGPRVRSEMEEYVEQSKKCEPAKNFRETLTKLNEPDCKHNLIKSIILFALLHFSGVYERLFYLKEFLDDKDEGLFVFVTGTIFCVGIIVTNVFLGKFSKRRLIIISTLGMALTSVCFLVIVPLEIKDRIREVLFYLIISLHDVFAGIGFVTIPWTLLPEVFPTDVRRCAALICVTLACCFGFVATLLRLSVIVWIINISITILLSPIFVLKWLPKNEQELKDVMCGVSFNKLQGNLESNDCVT